MQGNRQEYQLSSIDQALMDELTNRVRECYQEMTRIAMRTINGQALADNEFSQPLGDVMDETQIHLQGAADPFHDEEVCWQAGQDQEMCYKKGGGKVMIRPRRRG